MTKLTQTVPRKRIGHLWKIWNATSAGDNVEDLLSRLDAHIEEGVPWHEFSVPELRRAREELTRALSETLSSIQYGYLQQLYGYQRYMDPYFHWNRRLRLIRRIETSHPSASMDERETLIWGAESSLREGASVEDSPWALAVTQQLQILFGLPAGPYEPEALRVAAMAAGRERFANWLCRLWPFIESPLDRVLGLPKVIDNMDSVRTAARRLVALLDRLKVSGHDEGPLREELLQLLDRPGLRAQQIHDISGVPFLSRVFPALAKDLDWVLEQSRLLIEIPAAPPPNPFVLLGSVLEQDDAIVSFNYDLFAEIGIRLAAWRGYSYGFDALFVNPWDPHGPLTSFMWGFPPHVPILKLHGSVNWIACHSCGAVYSFVDSPARSTGTEGTLRDIADYFWRSHRDYPCCPFFSPSRTEIPITPPRSKRSMRLGPMAMIWSEARRVISSAEEIIFVGYSLSPTDQDFRALLRSAAELRLHMRERQEAKASKQPQRVYVVNPSPQVARRYRNFLQQLAAPFDERTPVEHRTTDYLLARFVASRRREQ